MQSEVKKRCNSFKKDEKNYIDVSFNVFPQCTCITLNYMHIYMDT